ITKHATEDVKFKFTSLVHLLNETTLKECFHMLDKGKAAGIDGVTYEEYEVYLNTNIQKHVKEMKRENIIRNRLEEHIYRKGMENSDL
ncbi:MAG: hypothetical protein FD166_3762, partial [Bacteroidetes bacterium]